jgi:hypothetical protein
MVFARKICCIVIGFTLQGSGKGVKLRYRQLIPMSTDILRCRTVNLDRVRFFQSVTMVWSMKWFSMISKPCHTFMLNICGRQVRSETIISVPRGTPSEILVAGLVSNLTGTSLVQPVAKTEKSERSLSAIRDVSWLHSQD